MLNQKESKQFKEILVTLGKLAELSLSIINNLVDFRDQLRREATEEDARH